MKSSLWRTKKGLDIGNILYLYTHTYTEPHKRLFTISLKNNVKPSESINQQFNSHVHVKVPQNELSSFRLYWGGIVPVRDIDTGVKI